jgi:hypothetical protein
MKTLIYLLLLATSTAYGQTKIFELSKLDSIDFTTFIADKKAIVIGEMHGTTEVPLFVLQLVRQLKETEKKLTIALEIESNYQNNLDEFIKKGDFEKLVSLDYFKIPDGRTSIAMGQLIKGLREIKGLRIICFDIPSGLDPRINRDSLMGVNLSRAYQGDKMVILTGNLHANLKEGFRRPDFRSAVYHFNKANNFGDRLISLNTYFGGGTIWNCMSDGCKERDAAKVNINKKNELKNFMGIYEAAHPSGYSGFIYFDNVTASKPLVQPPMDAQQR